MKYTTTVQYKRRFNPMRDYYISAQWEDSLYPEYQVEGYEGLLLKDGRHEFIELNFNYNLELNGDNLDITFTNETEERDLYKLRVPLSNFAGADAYTLWYINDSVLDTNLDVLKGERYNPPTDPEIITGQRYTVPKNEMVNAFANTLVSKSPNLLGVNSVISFLVTKSNPTVDDIIVILVRPRTSQDDQPDLITPEMVINNIQHTGGDGWADHLTSITGNVPAYEVNPVESIRSLIPEITIGNSTVDGDVTTVNFTTDPKVEYVYLEQSIGWLPKLKIPVDDQGNGSFKVITTGLDSGDEIRVKLGFKFWSTKALFTKTI